MSEPIIQPRDTVASLFHQWVEQRAGQVVFRQKCFGIWEESTWADFGQIGCEVAMGLMHFGFESGETAAVLSNTRREWAARMGFCRPGNPDRGRHQHRDLPDGLSRAGGIPAP
ncbi:MAG: hypothetical protein NTY05_02970 [Rhodocyclales bacterium]|nr:hypothetical protein [Rhodocyclales bacterium]